MIIAVSCLGWGIGRKRPVEKMPSAEFAFGGGLIWRRANFSFFNLMHPTVQRPGDVCNLRGKTAIWERNMMKTAR
jgi:hypothetical protein